MQYALAGTAPFSSWLVRVAPHDLEISNCSQALRAAHFSCPPILFSYSPLLAVEGIANLFTTLIHKALCSSPVVSSPHTWRSSGRWFLCQYLKPNLTSSPSSPHCVFLTCFYTSQFFLYFPFSLPKNLLSSLPFLKTNSNSQLYILIPAPSPSFYWQDLEGAVFVLSPHALPTHTPLSQSCSHQAYQ